MKEFFETLDVKEFQEYKHWLNSMVANETEQEIAEKFLNFMEKLEQSAATEYEICFDYPLDETKELAEQCPHCGEEFTIPWNLRKHGMVAHCPYCGKEIRLCSSCPTSKGYGECDYDNDSRCCLYHKESVKEAKVSKKPEDTQKSNDTKSSKETTTSRMPKKQPDLLHEIKSILQTDGFDLLETLLRRLEDGNILPKIPNTSDKMAKSDTTSGENSSGKNTKMSYYYIDADGNKHYKELIFSGSLNEEEEKAIFKCCDNHKFIPKFLNFPCDQEEGIGILLGFSTTPDNPTSAMTAKELVKNFEFLGLLTYMGINTL